MQSNGTRRVNLAPKTNQINPQSTNTSISMNRVNPLQGNMSRPILNLPPQRKMNSLGNPPVDSSIASDSASIQQAASGSDIDKTLLDKEFESWKVKYGFTYDANSFTQTVTNLKKAFVSQFQKSIDSGKTNKDAYDSLVSSVSLNGSVLVNGVPFNIQDLQIQRIQQMSLTLLKVIYSGTSNLQQELLAIGIPKENVVASAIIIFQADALVLALDEISISILSRGKICPESDVDLKTFLAKAKELISKEGTNWLKIGLIGGGILALGYGAYKLWQKQQEKVRENPADDDDDEVSSPPFITLSKSGSLVRRFDIDSRENPASDDEDLDEHPRENSSRKHSTKASLHRKHKVQRNRTRKQHKLGHSQRVSQRPTSTLFEKIKAASERKRSTKKAKTRKSSTPKHNVIVKKK